MRKYIYERNPKFTFKNYGFSLRGFRLWIYPNKLGGLATIIIFHYSLVFGFGYQIPSLGGFYYPLIIGT